MRNAGIVQRTILVLSGVLVFAATSCGPSEPVAETQPNVSQPKTAAAQTVAPNQVGSMANQAADYDQVGDHYQKSGPAFWVRPGYKVTLVASNMGNARFVEFDDRGTLYMSRPFSTNNHSDVVTLALQNDGTYKLKNLFLENLTQAQGLCWYKGWMYVSESTSIRRARDTNGDGKADDVEILAKDLQGGSGHWWRSLLVTDDGIYTSVGDPSNISDQTDTDRQKIFKYSLDCKSRELFASGLRNTEKLQLRPGTREVWGGDHGSDWYGKDYGVGEKEGFQPITDFIPPEEFNHYVKGGFYGHPFIIGNRLPRTEYMNRKDLLDLAEKTIPPAWSLGAHWAVNGFAFYTGDQFPEDCKGDAFVALHGSWNRKVKSGYRIERICFDKVTGLPYGSQMIVGTLTPDKKPLARPVDVVQAPDGSLLFTSDSNQSIYRLEYVGT